MTQPNQSPPLRGQTIIQYISLTLLLLLYLALAFAHAAFAPLTTGPDELAHYEYACFIAEHGRLPVTPEERAQASYKSDQPPLYHLLAALPMSLVDPTGPPTLKRVSDSPRRQLIERTRHAWGLYNTEDEGWPYRAEVLRWQVGRWVAILLGAATVAVTFFTARALFSSVTADRGPETGDKTMSWLLALAVAAVIAFIPRFILTGSMLNYETTVAFFSALFLWALLRVGCQVSGVRAEGPLAAHHAPRTTYILLLGLFAGLAILAKLSAVILPLEAVIGLWLIGRAQNWPRAVWLKTTLLTLTVAGLVVSLWFGFVVYHFNTVAADGLWTGLLRPLIAADSSDATTNQLLSLLTGGQAGFTGAIDNLESGPPWDWAAIFFRTFWMVGIEQVEPLAPSALIIALALCITAAAGLILSVRRPPTTDRREEFNVQCSTFNAPTPYPRLLLSLLTLHLALPFLLPLLRYAVTFSLADTAQGRHVLFSAAPAFAILLMWGLFRVMGHGSWITHQVSRLTLHISRFLLLLPVLLVLTWTAAQLWTMSWAYNPPLPVTTQREMPTPLAQQVNRSLNKYITLVGYNQQLDPDNRMLRLDLVWRATALSLVDYLTEVSLLDAQGQAQAQWLGYAANGRYPTRAWDVGDVVRDTIWLPVAGLAPGEYQLRLNLIPTSHSYPADQAVTPFNLAEVTLAHPALRLFNGALPFTDQAVTAAGFSIWQKGEATTGLHTFNYRETIVVTLSSLLPDQQRTIRLVGPASPDETTSTQPPTFAPIRELPEAVVFIVGPDWPTGDYHLQVTLAGGSIEPQQVNSDPLVRVVDLWQRQFTEPAMSRRVEANFAEQVKLLGYDLGANRANPGGGIPLTLYWQGLDWMGHDYTIFTKLLAADQSVHGGRDRLPREGYRTSYWSPGEIVSDPFGVPVDPDAPDGVYTINIGLYRQVGQQAVSLPLVQDGRPIDATSINIGPIKIGSAPPELTFTTAAPQHPLNQSFGDPPNLTLLGYDLDESSINNCQLSNVKCQLPLILYWRSESPLSLDYTTFVHLRNEAGQTVAQKDQPPLNGTYPTSLWDPGEIIADKLELPLPADLPPGTYHLVIGWYDLKSGARLPVPGQPDNSLTLQSVELGR